MENLEKQTQYMQTVVDEANEKVARLEMVEKMLETKQQKIIDLKTEIAHLQNENDQLKKKIAGVEQEMYEDDIALQIYGDEVSIDEGKTGEDAKDGEDGQKSNDKVSDEQETTNVQTHDGKQVGTDYELENYEEELQMEEEKDEEPSEEATIEGDNISRPFENQEKHDEEPQKSAQEETKDMEDKEGGYGFEGSVHEVSIETLEGREAEEEEEGLHELGDEIEEEDFMAEEGVEDEELYGDEEEGEEFEDEEVEGEADTSRELEEGEPPRKQPRMQGQPPQAEEKVFFTHQPGKEKLFFIG